jgi:hypothetical protein
MSMPISTEKRMLTANELDVVEQTFYPANLGRSREAMADSLKLLRGHRYTPRDRAQQQRQEMRGKVERRGIAATDKTGTKIKAEVFADDVKHISRELARARG